MSDPILNHWLKCSVTKGMFSTEMTVCYPPGSEHPHYASFISPDLLRPAPGKPGEWQVRVAVNRSPGFVLAMIPSEHGPDIFPVNELDLLPAESQ